MRKGIFITGTDTGVGKTYIAAGIAAGLRRLGVDVGVMKPAETGCRTRKGRLVPEDALKLMKAAGAGDPLDLVNPYRFKKPLAPSLAARFERKSIDPSNIKTAFKKLSRTHDFLIIEGAGGILVPLRHDYTYLDLARAFRLPVIIVARPGLGTINHTLLTISALQYGGIAVLGIVVNYARDTRRGLAETMSPSVIEEISGIPVLDVVAHRSLCFDTLVSRCSKSSPVLNGD